MTQILNAILMGLALTVIWIVFWIELAVIGGLIGKALEKLEQSPDGKLIARIVCAVIGGLVFLGWLMSMAG